MTYEKIRIQPETVQKLRILKLTADLRSYDEVIKILFKKAEKNNKRLYNILNLK